jgi:hypothetical protein
MCEEGVQVCADDEVEEEEESNELIAIGRGTRRIITYSGPTSSWKPCV